MLEKGEKKKERTRTHCKKIILDKYMNNLSSDLPEEGFYVEFMFLSLLVWAWTWVALWFAYKIHSLTNLLFWAYWASSHYSWWAWATIQVLTHEKLVNWIVSFFFFFWISQFSLKQINFQPHSNLWSVKIGPI